ncbi:MULTISPECIES: alpha/beta hydrolase [unclassified Rhodococcus (in: high G+C Gram-positive bacteria)]|uniref:alpha/beta hydrolase n=1 Tax=unclassified Rhodococcus (in: high G+C Gram-positive bacteria) TaxID=192944 RepID=UPI0016517F17|nr:MULTISPECIES: alpha/beta hydrolase [unclassified Rhodococcus (in: high G+C Gram-positive bacteria)]
MKIVFLHGIGDGDPKSSWLDGLDRGLAQAGFGAVNRDMVIAPRYSAFLATVGSGEKLPPVTYKPRDDSASRRSFERRQAKVQRMLGLEGGVRTFGFHRVPGQVLAPLQQVAIGSLPLFDLQQVRKYVREEPVRGAILRHILDHLPTSGEIILIGHSLGSVIAIDLLDHLPENLHVRRFITIGSPANVQAVHDGSERLLKKFPYGRVDDWSNFLDVGDVVTGGRGLATTFPGAQDFVIDNGASHASGAYLGHRALAMLVADILYPSKEVAIRTSDIAVRLNDNQASVLLMLHYAHAVHRNIKDKELAERYRHALDIVQDNIVVQIEQAASAGGQPVATEMQQLANGQLPMLPHRWEVHEVVGELVVLALTNIIDPYELEVGNAPSGALTDVAVELGFSRQLGKIVGVALEDVQKCLDSRGGVPWGRVITAAVGLALVAAGPVGLVMAAPATAFGAAALTGGLAAFGPGGMVGGLAMLGGLASTGAAVAATAAVGGGATEQPITDSTTLILRVSTEHAHKMLGLPYDESLWYQLADVETKLSARINRLTAFSDPKSGQLAQLQAAKSTITKLMAFMLDRGLAPRAVEAATAEKTPVGKELPAADKELIDFSALT